MVLRQLRYTGMLDTVKIRKSGYSVRYTFEVNGFFCVWGWGECANVAL